MTPLEYVKERKIVAIVRGLRPEYMVRLAHAFEEGGIGLMEVTYNQRAPETWADTAKAIEAVAKEFDERMLVGAGTVINAEQCEQALEAGAKFIVSPGLSVGVAAVCKANGITYYPGCATPTEIMQALDLGLNIVKFFPANVYGGLKALKALAAPFPQVRFIPTGGVNRDNLEEFLSFDKIYAVGGSFFVEDALKKYGGD